MERKWREHRDLEPQSQGMRERTQRPGVTAWNLCLRGAAGVREEEEEGSGKRWGAARMAPAPRGPRTVRDRTPSLWRASDNGQFLQRDLSEKRLRISEGFCTRVSGVDGREIHQEENGWTLVFYYPWESY